MNSHHLLPRPEANQTVDTFIGEIFLAGNVRGAGQNDNLIIEPGAQLATSRYDKFEDLPFSCGMDGLGGCTAIIVVSRKGVWTSHWWMNTFSQAFKGDPVIDRQFQEHVINYFTTTSPEPGHRHETIHTPLASIPDHIFAKENHPQMLVFSVERSVRDRSVKYPDAVAAMLAEVKRLVPAHPINEVAWTYPYMAGGAIDRGEQIGNACGKVLVNYTPGERKGSGSFETSGAISQHRLPLPLQLLRLPSES